MDISVLASVGSFLVSEHVLKPKASLLLILGCVLAYDLTTKTHDISSLRVYRGPGLLAFTLAMAAYSLRAWRRNGVACDELIFLPGTAHADTTILDENEMDLTTNGSSSPNSSPSMHRSSYSGRQQYTAVRTNSNDGLSAMRNQSTSNHQRNEGDVAAGVGSWNQTKSAGPVSTSRHTRENTHVDTNYSRRRSTPQESFHGEEVEMGMIEDMTTEGATGQRNRSFSKDSTISSINEFENASWDDDPLTMTDGTQVMDGDKQNGSVSSDEGLMRPLNTVELTPQSRPNATIHDNDCPMQQDPIAGGSHLTMRNIRTHVANDIREGQAQITRIGSMFFFRSTTTNTQNAVYAPSGPSVVGAALDLSMPVLFNFHLFISAWNHLGVTTEDKNPAKILPMCFLTALTVRMIVPFGRRRRFWSTIKFTATAPFNRSVFRDSYVGDVLTSLVRPLQDIAFSMAYYICGLWGLMSARYTLTESGDMLESSWILHTVILPSCALLPLWWRFLQTLRESYDTGRRWPHLGNAFKYLSAAGVIMYGMTHPEERGSITWMVVFSLALLYQVWWDTFMDWELFVIIPKSEEALDSANAWCTRISSVRPSSHFLLTLQRYVLNPIVEAVRSNLARIPSWKQFQLRPKRLYKTEAFYWKIFIFNTLFRFTWMLSFIPSYSLALPRRDPKEEFESDTDSYIGVLLPVAEIFRRTLWGLLYLEIQTIHMTDVDSNYRYASQSNNDLSDCDEPNHDEESDSAVSIDSSKRTQYRSSYMPSWLLNQLQIQDHVNHGSPSAFFSSFVTQIADYFKLNSIATETLFVAELCMWAVAFVALGMWATAQNK